MACSFMIYLAVIKCLKNEGYETFFKNARTSLCLLLFWLITYQPQPIVTIFIMCGVDAVSFHTVQNCLDLL